MSIEDSNEYQEALHFCLNNSPKVIARQMTKDMDDIRRLRAENAELRRDAERYRWLRDRDNNEVTRLFSREWDAAIDAALQDSGSATEVYSRFANRVNAALRGEEE